MGAPELAVAWERERAFGCWPMMAGVLAMQGVGGVDAEQLRLFHAEVPGVPGGFVGVDVFYVISGFLITGLLLREIGSNGRVGLTRFYARRMRRLLPAALVVIVVTLVASYWLLSSVRFPPVAIDAAASAAYVSNYRFALNATNLLLLRAQFT